MFIVRKKVLAASCSLALMSVFAPANAGFLNEMYDEMGANANVTGAQIYQTQRAGVVTGGGMVWKAPVRNFQPFGFTPPRLKSGCGGIDMFMGSFSMFSKDEFIQMMRAVAQNSAGLLFEMALQSLSPELASVMSKISAAVREMNEKFGNSCEMAKSIAGDNTALGNFAKSIGEQARAAGAEAGFWSDRAEAVQATNTDGAAVRANAPTKTTTTGDVIAASEMNITWNVMKSGSFTGLTTADKEMLQTMLGTIIVTWRDDIASDSEDQHLTTNHQPARGKKNIQDWIGTSRSAGNDVQIKVYQCDEPVACMSPVETDVTYRALSKTVYRALDELRTAVVERRAPVNVDGMDPRAVVAMTSLPIGNVINMVTSPAYGMLGDSMLQIYADSIAYDIATRLMEELLLETKKALLQYKTGGSPAAIDMVNLRKGMEEFKEELWALRDDVSKKVVEQNTAILHFAELEKVVVGNMSKKVLSSLDFGKSQ